MTTTSWAKGSFLIPLLLLYPVFLLLFYNLLITGYSGQPAQISTNSETLKVTTGHNPQWPQEIVGLYHVFLSFRGANTRNGFTSHLFAALERNGFHTFIDDKRLKFGEYISSQLNRAIEDSRISLIVFSKNYAGSKWCLDELLKIMDCKEAFNQIVIPIFYDVDPSDVSEQRGVVEAAFAMHKKRFREDTLEKWKRALTNAANLPGWDLRNVANGNEAELIKIITEAVGEILVDEDPTQGYERHFQISQIRPPIPRRPSPLFPQITERPLCPACRHHAAVLEYLAAELGNAARDNKKSGIMKRAASFWGWWLLRMVEIGSVNKSCEFCVSV